MHTPEQHQGFSVWTSRPFVIIITFCALSLAASQLKSPWWGGELLDVDVRWPEQFAAIGLKNAALPAPAPEQAPGEESGHELPVLPVTQVSQVELAAQSVAGARVTALLMSKHAANKDRNAFERENKQLIASLTAQLGVTGKPQVRLERPCLTKDASGKCTLRALDTFFEQLRETQLKRRKEPVRMSQYGDSLISGDGFTGELRRMLQDQFGDGGHGFVPLKAPSRFMGFDGLSVSASEAWRLDSIASSSSKKERLLGVGGVAFEVQGAPTLKIEAKDKGREFERLGLMATPKGSDKPLALKVKLDSKPDVMDVQIQPQELADNLHWIKLDPGSAKIELSGFGQGATYYGVLVERAGSGIVVDNFGMLSSRASSLVRMDSKRWKQQLKSRGVNLASFSFGTNSAGPGKPSSKWIESYKKVYEHVLKSAQGLEEDRDCMVLGMLTRASRTAQGIEQLPSVEPLVEAQRETAIGSGCAFWNMNAAMGGAKGPGQWYNSAPRLLGSDFTHPTRAGYKKLAQLFYQALLYEFKIYLEHGPGAE